MQSNEKIPSFHSIHQQFCHLPPQDTHLNSSMNSPLVRQLLLLNFCVIKSPYKLISHFLLSFQLKDLSGSDLLKNELVTDMSLELGSFLKYGYIIRFNIGRQDSQAIERYFTSNQSSKIILGIFSLSLPFFFLFHLSIWAPYISHRFRPQAISFSLLHFYLTGHNATSNTKFLGVCSKNANVLLQVVAQGFIYILRI